MGTETVELQTMLMISKPTIDKYKRFNEPFKEARLRKILTLTHLQITNLDLIQTIIPFLHANPDVNDVNLMDNRIGDLGATELSKLQTVTSLYLQKNKIGVQGAKSLANNHIFVTLKLDENPIKPEGVAAFSNALDRGNKTLSILTCAHKPSGKDMDIQLLSNFGYHSHLIRQEIAKAFQEMEEAYCAKIKTALPKTPGVPGVISILYGYLGVQQFCKSTSLIRRPDPDPASENPKKKRLQTNN